MMRFSDELIMAGRGVFAIAMGKRDCEKYFNLTIVGLTGATIALIFALAISAYVPALLGSSENGLTPSKALIYTAGVYLFQTGGAAIVLNLMSRLDGLVPYLITDFYSTFFITILTLIPAILSLENDLVLMILAILMLVIKINIIRLIIKLSISKIILFFMSHLLAGFIGIIVLSSVLGIDPLAINQSQ